MSDGAEVRCALCREAVAQIGGRNWEGPPDDRSEFEGWHSQLL